MLQTHLPLADLLLPGTKRVVHELSFEPSPHWNEWTLVATPMFGFHGLKQLAPDQPFPVSQKYHTRIVALRRDEPVPESVDRARIEAHPSSAPPVELVQVVGVWNPLEHVVTRVRIEGVEGMNLRLVATDETREYAWPPLVNVLGPLAIVAAGVFLLVRLRRRARKA